MSLSLLLRFSLLEGCILPMLSGRTSLSSTSAVNMPSNPKRFFLDGCWLAVEGSDGLHGDERSGENGVPWREFYNSVRLVFR